MIGRVGVCFRSNLERLSPRVPQVRRPFPRNSCERERREGRDAIICVVIIIIQYYKMSSMVTYRT